MSEIPQTDVSRPSALPIANLHQRPNQNFSDQNSAEYLDNVENEWNKKVDSEVETLVDGMVDLVSLATVCCFPLGYTLHSNRIQIGDKDKFRIAQEAFQAQSRAESMVRTNLSMHAEC